jgi:NAD(P)-dependent dehydrogenase (short-subunit alcohol dehydrogenase family)
VRPVEQQTILITGATDGLGRGVATELAGRGATVLVHGRDPDRIERTIAEIREATGSERVRGYRADLASLAQVRSLADEVSEENELLHGLVNNAGLGTAEPGGGERMESEDGYELRFAVNYLAGFLLTRLLEPMLIRSAPARIVNVSSAGQASIDFEDVMLEHRYDGLQAYCQSKLAQVMFTLDEAERLREHGVTVNCLHPSTYMPTKMVLEEIGRTVDTLEAGVEATVRLAIGPELEGVTGRFYDRRHEAAAHPQAYDAAARRRLWDLSAELTEPRDAG